MILRSIQGISDGAARPGGVHRWNEAVFLECGPIRGPNQIEAFAAKPCRLATAVFKRHVSREDASRDGLLEPCFAPHHSGSRGLRERCSCRCGKTQNELSTAHGVPPFNST